MFLNNSQHSTFISQPLRIHPSAFIFTDKSATLFRQITRVMAVSFPDWFPVERFNKRLARQPQKSSDVLHMTFAQSPSDVANWNLPKIPCVIRPSH
jgi:hypothetical protein